MPTPRAKIRPSAAWYWIGGVLIALGVIGFFVVLSIWFLRTSDAVDKFARVIVPPGGAEADLQFKKPGEYTLYYEYRSEVDGQRVNNPNHDPPTQLAVTITDQNGTNIPVKPYTSDFSVSVNDKLGPAFGKINIPAPGTYTMKVTSAATAPFVVAIGKGVLQSIWPWWLLGALALFVIGVGLGLFAIISTAVKRGRRKREMRRAQQMALGGAVPAYAGVGAGEAATAWSTPPPPAGWGSPGPGGYPPPPGEAPAGQPFDRPSSGPTAEQPAPQGWPTPGDRPTTQDQPVPSDRPASGGWPSPGQAPPSANGPAAGDRPSSGEQAAGVRPPPGQWPSPSDRPASDTGAAPPTPPPAPERPASASPDSEPTDSTDRPWGPPQR
jgi:hypothetical protein